MGLDPTTKFHIFSKRYNISQLWKFFYLYTFEIYLHWVGGIFLPPLPLKTGPAGIVLILRIEFSKIIKLQADKYTERQILKEIYRNTDRETVERQNFRKVDSRKTEFQKGRQKDR